MFKKILTYGLQNINLSLKNVLFLPSCILCQNPLVYRGETLVCRECLNNMQLFPADSCVKCGKYITVNRILCGECVFNPPKYKRHLSYTAYDKKMKELILLYKYGQIIPLKKILSAFLLNLYRNRIKEKFDLIIPVPPDRGRNRFFFPIREMSQIVAKKLKIPLMINNLLKIKETEPQAKLSRSRRVDNLNKAFILLLPS